MTSGETLGHYRIEAKLGQGGMGEVWRARDGAGWSGTALVVGKPRVLFEGQFFSNPGASNTYDISPDGRRFLMVREAGAEAPPAQLTFLWNWFEELRQGAK